MKAKLAITLSVFLTVVILTVVGGVLSASKNATTVASATAQTAAMDPNREAQYQALIAQANETIAQANQKIAELSANQASPEATATPYPVAADQASAIASRASGEVAVSIPELVNYSGKVAYSVTFPDGIVYVDATTGDVLYNGVQVAQIISKDQASQIAINYTGDTRVVEVISGTYNGAGAYRVTFSNGEMVYIDLYGNILAVQLPAYTAPSSGNGEHEGEGED